MSRPPAYQLLRADCGRGIPLADGSINAVVTSPPYYALRSYAGVAPTDWPEISYAPMPGLPPLVVPAMTCCLGAEPDPAAFVGHLVAIFDDVRRVMHKSGCAWVNLGDGYVGNGPVSQEQTEADIRFARVGNATSKVQRRLGSIPYLASKNLLMVPARFALAMQAAGWYLRAAPPWIKPGNAMPESCQDRPTTAHESLFMFTKSPDYYFDMDSVRVNAVVKDAADYRIKLGAWGKGTGKGQREGIYHAYKDVMPSAHGPNPAGRSLRTADLFLESLDDLIAWHRDRLHHLTRTRQSGGLVASDADDPAAVLVNPEAFRGSHYAVMPSRLAEILVRCSTSEAGVCGQCGAPWERVVERTKYQPQVVTVGKRNVDDSRGDKTRKLSGKEYNEQVRILTLGWRPTCSCPPGPTRPALVLDPFVGSGTTLVAANALERDALGLDASADYLRMAARRLDRPHARPLAEPADDGPGPLFSGGES
jgi:hypothetical protein